MPAPDLHVCLYVNFTSLQTYIVSFNRSIYNARKVNSKTIMDCMCICTLSVDFKPQQNYAHFGLPSSIGKVLSFAKDIYAREIYVKTFSLGYHFYMVINL